MTQIEIGTPGLDDSQQLLQPTSTLDGGAAFTFVDEGSCNPARFCAAAYSAIAAAWFAMEYLWCSELMRRYCAAQRTLEGSGMVGLTRHGTYTSVRSQIMKINLTSESSSRLRSLHPAVNPNRRGNTSCDPGGIDANIGACNAHLNSKPCKDPLISLGVDRRITAKRALLTGADWSHDMVARETCKRLDLEVVKCPSDKDPKTGLFRLPT